MPRRARTAKPIFRSKARNTSARGASAERELRKKFEAKDCLVVRATGSFGECGDLLVLVPGTEPLWIVGCSVPITHRILLVEVKCGQQRVWEPARAKMRELAGKYGALAMVALRADQMPAAERWTIEAA